MNNVGIAVKTGACRPPMLFPVGELIIDGFALLQSFHPYMSVRYKKNQSEFDWYHMLIELIVCD